MAYDREALLAFFKPNVIPVTVTVEDKTIEVFVKELSAEEVFDLQSKRKKDGEDTENNRAFAKQLLSTALVDQDGNALFTGNEVGKVFGAKIKVFNELSRAVAVAAGLEIAAKEPPKEGGEEQPGKA